MEQSIPESARLECGLCASSALSNDVRSWRRIGGFVLEDIHYPSGTIIPTHTHSISGVYVTYSGEGREIWNGREQPLLPGTAIFRPAGDPHSNLYSSPTSLVVIGMPAMQIARLAGSGVCLQNPVVSRSGSLALLAQKIASHLRADNIAAMLIVEGAALEILGELFQKPAANGSSAVAHAEALLRQTFKRPLSLWALARAVNLHPVHLSREFRRLHHMTIGEYIRKLRIEYVCVRLRSSPASLSDLAHEAGFTDHSHLSRTFKSLMGTSPSDFRAATRSARVVLTADDPGYLRQLSA